MRRNSGLPIKGQFEYHFNIDDYNLLSVKEEKVEFITNSLVNFIQASGGNKYQKSTNPMFLKECEDFANALPLLLEYHPEENIINICLALYVLAPQFDEIPKIESYITITKILFYKYTNEKDPDSSICRGLNVLFSSNRFCHVYCQTRKIVDFIKDYANNNDFIHILQILPIFQTKAFFENSCLFDPDNLVEMLNIVLNSNENEQLTSPIISFIMQMVPNIYSQNQNITSILYHNNIFNRMNNKLLPLHPSIIWAIYSNILHMDSATPDPFVLRLINSVYRKSVCSDQTRTYILESLNSEPIWDREFCLDSGNFDILEWYVESVCCNSNLLRAYLKITNRVLELQPERSSDVVSVLLSKIVPFPDDNVCVEEIYGYLKSLLLDTKLNSAQFGDDIFLRMMFTAPSEFDVAMYTLGFEQFQSILKILMDNRRSDWYRRDVVGRMLEILSYDKQGMLMNLVSGILESNLSANVVLELIEKIDKPCVLQLAKRIAGIRPEFVQIMEQCDAFNNCAEHLSNENYVKCLFDFITAIVARRSCHVFDEWVLLQPPDSPIFSLSDSIMELIKPQQDQEELIVPSLIGLTDFNVSPMLPSNMVLVGKFAIPVLSKLGKPLTKLPYLKDVAAWYIRTEDFITCIDEDMEACMSIITSNEDPNLYEFSPSRAPALMTIEAPKSTCFIKFANTMNTKYPLLTIDCNKFYLLNGILESNGHPLITLPVNFWHSFSVTFSKGKVDLMIDRTPVFSGKSAHGYYLIGDEEWPTPVLFFVAAKVSCEMTDFDIAGYDIIPEASGTYTYVAKNSLKNILSNRNIMTEIVDHIMMQHLNSKTSLTLSLLQRFTDHSDMDIELYLSILWTHVQGVVLKAPESSFLVQFIFLVSSCADESIVTKYLIETVTCVDLWSLHPEMMSTFIFSITSMIKSTSLSVNFLALFEGVSDVLMAVLFSHIKTNSDVLLEFIYIIVEHCNSLEITKKIAEVAKSAAMIETAYGGPVGLQIIAGAIARVNKSSEIQTKLITFVLKLEQQFGVELIEKIKRLHMAIGTDNEIALRLLLPLLKDDLFVKEKTIIIAVACQRFAMDGEHWSNFLSILTNTMISIDSNSNPKSNSVTAFIVATAMLSTVVRFAESEQYVNKCYRLYNQIFGDMKSNLLLNPTAELFFQQIVSGNSPYLKVLDLPYEDLEMDIDNEKASELYNGWRCGFKASIAERFKVPIPESRMVFVNGFLLDIIEENKENEKVLPLVIQASAVFAPSEVLVSMVCTLLEQLSSSSMFFQLLFAFILKYAAINRKEIFSNGIIAITVSRFLTITDFPSITAFVELMRDISLTAPSSDMSELIKAVIPLVQKNFNTNPTAISKLRDPILLTLFRVLMRDEGNRIDHNIVRMLFDTAKLLIKDDSDESLRIIKEAPAPEYMDYTELMTAMESDLAVQNDKIFSKMEPGFVAKMPPLAPAKEVLEFGFSQSLNSIFSTMDILRRIYQTLNRSMRKAEGEAMLRMRCQFKLRDVSQSQSVFVSSTDVPGFMRMALGRSVFSLPQPGHQIEITKPAPTMVLGIKPAAYAYPVRTELKELCMRASIVRPEVVSIRNMFEGCFGEIERLASATFVRLDVRVRCVVVLGKQGYFILLGAFAEGNEIILSDFSSEYSDSIFSGVFAGEYGEVSLFIGRPVILLKFVTMIVPYNYLSHSNAINVHTAVGGSFIIDFDGNEDPHMLRPFVVYSKLVPRKSEIVEEYCSGRMSLFDFLHWCNALAQRSTEDLSAYPIFPRVLQSFEERDKYRDLSLPIQVAGGKSNEENSRRKFRTQHFHHSENLSNSTLVSSLNLRLGPFCRSLWEINDGWDQGKRTFRSVAFHYGVTTRSLFELVPESFALPEVLMNMNAFAPNGEVLESELPFGIGSAPLFIEFHRSVLESDSVRTRIQPWLDLVFGRWQSGELAAEHLNVFHPLSYHVSAATPVIRAKQATWMANCGSVPYQIFDTAVEPRNVSFEPLHAEIGAAADLSVIRGGVRFVVNKKRSTIGLSNGFEVPFAVHSINDVFVNPNGLYIIITNAVSRVCVLMVTRVADQPSGLAQTCSATVKGPRFTVASAKQMVAATAHEGGVLVWSTATGAPIAVLKENNITAIAVDDEAALFVIVSGRRIAAYTFAGTLVREAVLQERITSVCCARRGFDAERLQWAVGTEAGRILLLRASGAGFEVAKKFDVCADPIRAVRLEGDALIATDYRDLLS